MSKELTIKEERVKDLASQCPEYKTAMETLFPEVFKSPEKPKKEDITDQITWKILRFSGDNRCWLMGSYGEDVAFIYLNASGISFNHIKYEEKYEISTDARCFRVFKK